MAHIDAQAVNRGCPVATVSVVLHDEDFDAAPSSTSPRRSPFEATDGRFFPDVEDARQVCDLARRAMKENGVAEADVERDNRRFRLLVNAWEEPEGLWRATGAWLPAEPIVVDSLLGHATEILRHVGEHVTLTDEHGVVYWSNCPRQGGTPGVSCLRPLAAPARPLLREAIAKTVQDRISQELNCASEIAGEIHRLRIQPICLGEQRLACIFCSRLAEHSPLPNHESLQQRVMEMARRAGAADVARSALHNIGNVLTSVATTSAMIRRRVDRSRIDDLPRLVQRLKDNPKPDPTILDGLQALAVILADDFEFLRAAAGRLSRGVRDVSDILHGYRDDSRSAGLVELVRLDRVLDSALEQNTARIQGLQVHIDRRYACAPERPVQRTSLLQILGNLIKNALDALETVSNRPRRLTVSIACEEKGFVRILVRDNGPGIPQDKADSIFETGWSTKPHGQGIGLAFARDAARMLGGSLALLPEDGAPGAAFALDLPLVQP